MQLWQALSLLIHVLSTSGSPNLSSPDSPSSHESLSLLLSNLKSPANSSSSSPLSLDADLPDPYQFRVPDTATSLILSHYGRSVDRIPFLALTATTQYKLVQEAVAAQGDGPVPRQHMHWNRRDLYLHVQRPLRQRDLTWLMVADTVEGLRLFFERAHAWFELRITILDDTAGVVGSGSLEYSR
ncbi:hypothetical protein G7Y79_00018g045050 [Physcia stellaris]|nr:hypothetical protein G7Y79_00018g045050 [Physcia stellaris]